MKVKTKLESKSGKSKKSQQTLKKVKTKRKKVKSHAQDGSDFAKETTAPDYKVEFEITTVHPTFATGKISSNFSGESSPTGILHASQLADEPTHMCSALSSIMPFQKLTCYVINRHNHDSSLHEAVQLSQKKPERIQQFSEEAFTVGTKVMAFVSAVRHEHRVLMRSKENKRLFTYEFGVINLLKFGGFILYSNEDDVYDVEVTPELKGRIHGYLIPEHPSVSKNDYVGRALECRVLTPSDPLQLGAKGCIIDGTTGEEVSIIKEGCVIRGKVHKIEPWGLLIQTSKGVAFAHITELFDEFIDSPLQRFKLGQYVNCYVLECSTSSMMKLTLKSSHTCVTSSRDTSCVVDIKNLNKGDLLQGYVKSANEYGVFISLSRNLVARASLSFVPREIITTEDIKEVLYPGRLVTCYVTGVSESKVNVSLLRKHTGVGLDLKRKESFGYSISSSNKRAKIVYRTREEAIAVIKNYTVTSAIEVRSISSFSDDGVDDPGWDDVDDDITTKQEEITKYESDEEKPKVKHLSKKQRMELAEAEESALRRREAELMDDTKVPQSPAEWERLMTSEPDNSMLWIRYMAFHIHSTEVEQAREVAEKALRTINFRKENEKLNIWVSLLNLENIYGSDVTMEQTLRRAMQENDQRKVLKHLVNIYTQAGKLDKAKETHEMAIKKFRGDKDIWLAYIRHLMADHKQQNVQEVLGRCLKSVDKHHHMEVISKVAQMEFRHGDVERGRTIFENLISSFPKRTDVWSIYIDMLVQLERFDEAREIFNRVTSSNLSSKKISSFFKRFVEFEVNHGNESTIHEAKNKAIAYLNDTAK